jgi:Multimeric flavodoxin WrbA
LKTNFFDDNIILNFLKKSNGGYQVKKLAAFVGSPDKKGTTATLVGQIIKGAEESGASARIYTLNDLNIRYCQGCMHCRKTGTGCSIKDDMQEIYRDFKESDAIVIGSPIYAHQVSAQTKTFIDRLFALWDGSFDPKLNVKKAAIVYSQGNPDPGLFKPYFDLNSALFRNLGLEVMDTIISAGNDGSQKAKLAARAFEIGGKLVQ